MGTYADYDEYTKPILAKNLETLRKKKNLSQRECAEQLRIPFSSYTGYENGRREPKYLIMDRIARFYGVTLDELLGRENPDVVRAANFFRFFSISVRKNDRGFLELNFSKRENTRGALEWDSLLPSSDLYRLNQVSPNCSLLMCTENTFLFLAKNVQKKINDMVNLRWFLSRQLHQIESKESQTVWPIENSSGVVTESSIGKKILYLRHIHGTDVESIASKTGIDTDLYLKYESGEALPDVKDLCALANAYGVPIYFFIGSKDIFVDQLRKARKSQKISIQTMASHLGISKMQYEKYEEGQVFETDFIDGNKLPAILSVLKMSIYDLMSPVFGTFGERLRNSREDSQLSPMELIHKANIKIMKNDGSEDYISESTYEGYEYGTRIPKYETICKLADALMVSIDFLFGRIDMYFYDSLNEAEALYQAAGITITAKEDSNGIHCYEVNDHLQEILQNQGIPDSPIRVGLCSQTQLMRCINETESAINRLIDKQHIRQIVSQELKNLLHFIDLEVEKLDRMHDGCLCNIDELDKESTNWIYCPMELVSQMKQIRVEFEDFIKKLEVKRESLENYKNWYHDENWAQHVEADIKAIQDQFDELNGECENILYEEINYAWKEP